jgi:hypothetical protein
MCAHTGNAMDQVKKERRREMEEEREKEMDRERVNI